MFKYMFKQVFFMLESLCYYAGNAIFAEKAETRSFKCVDGQMFNVRFLFFFCCMENIHGETRECSLCCSTCYRRTFDANKRCHFFQPRFEVC